MSEGRRFARAALVGAPLVLLLGTLSARIAGSTAESPWFRGVTKPGFYPEPWVFGVAWSILYVLIAVAAAFIIAARGTPGRGLALTLFGLQLALNLAWSPLFFRAHEIGASALLIPLIFIVAFAATWAFWRVQRVAALLMIPYLLWLMFAGVLAARIWSLNPEGSRFADNPVIDVRLAQE